MCKLCEFRYVRRLKRNNWISLKGNHIYTSTCAARKNGDLAYIDGFFLWGPHLPCGSTQRPMSGSRPSSADSQQIVYIYSSYSLHQQSSSDSIAITGRHLHRWMKKYICEAVTQPGVVTSQGKTCKRPSSLLIRGPYRPLISFSYSLRWTPLSDSVAITGRHLHRQMKRHIC